MFSFLLAVIYLSFISLGLPDSILGAAWPSMQPMLDVPVSYAGIVSSIIAVGTIISSLMSDKVTRALGAGKTTTVSVGMTALALLGFSFVTKFWQLCLLAIPYGLGAGSVDASLNNYVALHYSSKHMSWLHCMWGVGAALGPSIMGVALTNSWGWDKGYLIVSVIQMVLTVVLIISLPFWKKRSKDEICENGEKSKSLSLIQVFKIKGAKAIMLMFFCYCAIEATVILWASTYLNSYRGIDAETAALFGSMYLIGMTVGRAVSGFITAKLNDTQMIRLGLGITTVGVVMVLLPFNNALSLAGLIVMGLGCAPIYPCIIHSTPERFGADRSQALIGVQMASAYTGTCLMPPLFGLIAQYIGIYLFPVFIAVILILSIVMHEYLCHSLKKTQK
ncbi:MAG: MFS transporter [Clostridia bacterium]|nr:MFS transporter [Clostridia bacterium]